MSSADDEIRHLVNAWRELSDDALSALLARGWARTNPHASGDEPSEWIWPPTAPTSYRQFAEWYPTGMRLRGLVQEFQTPWRKPTRLLQLKWGWRLEHGAALAQEADAARHYSDDAELIADLERIECWPMSVEETRREQRGRLWHTTTAAARDDHVLAPPITEPYGSRIDSIHAARTRPGQSRDDDSPVTPHDLPSDRGRSYAQWALIDAQAWASAVRTARAGGEGWNIWSQDDAEDGGS